MCVWAFLQIQYGNNLNKNEKHQKTKIKKYFFKKMFDIDFCFVHLITWKQRLMSAQCVVCLLSQVKKQFLFVYVNC